MDALDMQLALGRAPGLTAQQLRRALSALQGRQDHSTGLQALFRQCSSSLASLGLAAAAVAALQAPDRVRLAADRRWVESKRVSLIDAAGPLYPPQLAQAAGAPALLYVKGDAACLATPQLAVVGSRNPTLPGQRTARAFASQLSGAGLTITSGLAIGIDAASHEGALQAGGATIAVLGTGIDVIYPRQHRTLAARIAERGALVSEYPPGSPPIRANFPRRNRIISGLCLGTLVVEAARHSGSLITARLALEQGRELFAIPGSIHNPLARGCHALISSGAKLVECADDILQELKFSSIKQHVTGGPRDGGGSRVAAARLDKEYKILLDALGFEPASLDMLVDRTGLPSQSVASMLLFLELEDVVGLHSGGRYVRL
ncbi:MAG: DNA-processing protein DprA [Steroidobacterales bacterium]